MFAELHQLMTKYDNVYNIQNCAYAVSDYAKLHTDEDIESVRIILINMLVCKVFYADENYAMPLKEHNQWLIMRGVHWSLFRVNAHKYVLDDSFTYTIEKRDTNWLVSCFYKPDSLAYGSMTFSSYADCIKAIKAHTFILGRFDSNAMQLIMKYNLYYRLTRRMIANINLNS